MKVYLVAGAEMHDGIAAVMTRNGLEIVGHEYTMDAAVVALKRKPVNPDLFLVNGLAQASGATEGVINRNRSMLVKLKEIRMAAPKSRILLILPGENSPDLIHNIISLGIYDIRQTSRFDEPTLLGWINSPMSIADFKGFKTGQVPDIVQGEIRYSDGSDGGKQKQYPKKLGGFQAGIDLVSKIAGSLTGGVPGAGDGCTVPFDSDPVSKIIRRRTGRPGAVLGVGDTRIEDWIKQNFCDQMDVLSSSAEPEEIKQKIIDLCPHICVIMRRSSIGGIPDADEVAVWAAAHVPAVLFIVGDLDGPGIGMVNRVREAGVRHVISCEKGGYISGDELVYVLTSIVREMQDPGQEEGVKEPGKAVNSLLQGEGTPGAIQQPADIALEKAGKKMPAKKKRPRINMSEGLSLGEETPREAPVMSRKNPTSIVPGGILAIVSPWRPNLAGRLAAHAVRILSEVEGSVVAYLGASKDSTGAVWLDVPDDELMMSDWRVPGSNCPIVKDNIRIYAVDPAKDLPVEGEKELWVVLKEARKSSTYTVLDFAGDMSEARKSVHQGRAVVLVVLPGNDPVEFKISKLWLRNFMEGKQNVVTGIDLRGVPKSIPEGLRPKVVIRNNPADALASVLMKNSGEEFIWI